MNTEKLRLGSSFRKSIARAAEILKNGGYDFVKVSDLIYKENYTIDHTGRQHSLER